MSNTATGLAPSYIWPGSGSGSTASAGISQLGNARCAVAGNSAVTGGYGDGYLLFNTTHASLHHIGSTGTSLLGHSSMLDHGTGAGRWVTRRGSLTFLGGGSPSTQVVTWTTPYAQPPFVQLSVDTTKGFLANISSITAGGFISVATGLQGSPVQTFVFWESSGTL